MIWFPAHEDEAEWLALGAKEWSVLAGYEEGAPVTMRGYTLNATKTGDIEDALTKMVRFFMRRATHNN